MLTRSFRDVSSFRTQHTFVARLGRLFGVVWSPSEGGLHGRSLESFGCRFGNSIPNVCHTFLCSQVRLTVDRFEMFVWMTAFFSSFCEKKMLGAFLDCSVRFWYDHEAYRSKRCVRLIGNCARKFIYRASFTESELRR